MNEGKAKGTIGPVNCRAAVWGILVTLQCALFPSFCLSKDGALLYDSKVYKVEDEPGISGRLIVTFRFQITPENAQAILTSQLSSLAKVFPPQGSFVGRASLLLTPAGEPLPITFPGGALDIKIDTTKATDEKTTSGNTSQGSSSEEVEMESRVATTYLEKASDYFGPVALSINRLIETIVAFDKREATQEDLKGAVQGAKMVESKYFHEYINATTSRYDPGHSYVPPAGEELNSRIKKLHVIWQEALDAYIISADSDKLTGVIENEYNPCATIYTTLRNQLTSRK